MKLVVSCPTKGYHSRVWGCSRSYTKFPLSKYRNFWFCRK